MRFVNEMMKRRNELLASDDAVPVFLIDGDTLAPRPSFELDAVYLVVMRQDVSIRGVRSLSCQECTVP